jgi:hypothetical protein
MAVGEGERIQQCRIYDAEHPCRGGNSDGEGDDGRRGETGASAEGTQRVAEIATQIFRPTRYPLGARLFLDQRRVAERRARLPSGLLWS